MSGKSRFRGKVKRHKSYAKRVRVHHDGAEYKVCTCADCGHVRSVTRVPKSEVPSVYIGEDRPGIKLYHVGSEDPEEI